MKNILYFLSVMLLVFITSSCADRDVMDRKEGVTLPIVDQLKSTLSGADKVTLTWNIPSDISAEVERPLSVYIQVYKGATLEHQISLTNEPETWTYQLKEPDSAYRIVVKLYGRLKEKSYGKSDEIYSLGQTVEVH